MAQSDALKIAKIQRKAAQDLLVRDVVVSILQNPLVTFLGGSWGILVLQERYGTQRGFFEWAEKGAGLTAAGGIATAQALAPVLPDLLKAGGEAAGSVLKAVPLLP